MTTVDLLPEHRWLQRLVGLWTFTIESNMGPEEASPPTISPQATETTRGLGEVWIMSEGTMPMPDGSIGHTVMTLGYDHVKQRFVGTFIGSMMTSMWLYEGALDITTSTLTLDTEGPSFTDPTKSAKFQDIVELRSDDHRVLSSQYLDEQGQWHRFMTAHYHRVK